MREIVNVFIPKLSENKFLAVTRASLDKVFGSMSALPGGSVEIGEDLLTTARREMKEETGVYLSDLLSEAVLISTPELLGQPVKLYVFEGKIESENFKPIDPDISGVGWVDPKTFLESLRKFGYPETECAKFEKFLADKGFTI